MSNPSVNSCLAEPGAEYVVYVLNDASATLDLGGLAGKAVCRIYDPKTGAWGEPQELGTAGKHTFTKPPGADDWVVHIRGAKQ